jgi:hypothetical protein
MALVLNIYARERSLLCAALGIICGRIEFLLEGKIITSKQVLTTVEGARDFCTLLARTTNARVAGLEEILTEMNQKSFLGTREELFRLIVSKADLRILRPEDLDLDLCRVDGGSLPAQLPHVYLKRNRGIISACYITLESLFMDVERWIQNGDIAYDQGLALLAKAYALGVVSATSRIEAMRGKEISDAEYLDLILSFGGSPST